MFKNKKGFTLVELLVVVAIIGLLSTLAVVALGSARQKARDAKRVSDIKQVQTALELFFSDSNRYPQADVATTLGVVGPPNTTTLSSVGFSGAAVAPTYMGQVPSNPSPSGTAYSYTCAGAQCASYTLTFTLEGQTGGLAAGLRSASPSGIQ